MTHRHYFGRYDINWDQFVCSCGERANTQGYAHAHRFTTYDAREDVWVCSCGARADRFGVVTLRNADIGDPGVRSGRELLSC